jgi:biotin operon repressor
MLTSNARSPSESTSEQRLEDTAQLFRALADPVRLRLVGLLAEAPHCGQELAAALHLAPPTVSHHLRRLREAGLLKERREAPYTYYELDVARFRARVREVLKRESVQEFAARPDVSKEKRRVLESFFEAGRLKAIPAQRRKKEIVFEEILRRLPRQDAYPERELSRLLERFHSDFCTIRREFVMGRYMERERGLYRLAPRGLAVIAGDEPLG